MIFNWKNIVHDHTLVQSRTFFRTFFLKEKKIVDMYGYKIEFSLLRLHTQYSKYTKMHRIDHDYYATKWQIL